MKTLLALEQVTKYFRSYWTYRRLPAVENLSLEVGEGEAFGFLGHNGAGKTTTMKCVVGLLRPNSGRIIYQGKELSHHSMRSDIGYLPELPYFYDHLSVEETIDFFADLYGLSGTDKQEKVDSALGRVRLNDRRKQRVRELSKGLQQRLGMAGALLNRPKLLMLDEPFSGLDPLGRREFREILFELKERGATIFLSTHVLSDIEDICDRVAIMNRGKLAATFSLADVPRLFGSSFALSFAVPEEMSAAAAGLEGFGTVSYRESPQGRIASLTVAEYASAERLLEIASASGLRLESFERVIPTLEDIFVQITEGAAAGGVGPGAGAAGQEAPESALAPQGR